MSKRNHVGSSSGVDRQIRQKISSSSSTTTVSRTSETAERFVYSQGNLGYPRKVLKASVGSTINLEHFECRLAKIKKYETLIPAMTRQALEQGLFRYIVFTGLSGSPLKVEQDFFSKQIAISQLRRKDKNIAKEVLIYVTRKALRDVFGLDLVMKGAYVAKKDGDEELCVWENDRKKVYYLINILATPPIHGDDVFDEKSRVTDGHYQALRNSSEYEAALYGFLQLVLAIVYWSPDHCVTEIDLLTQLNTNYFRDLDLVATKSRSRQLNDQDPVLGNVKRLITEQFVRDDYLKETSYDDLKAYELGGKAFYVIDRQSLMAFSLHTSGVSIQNNEWEKISGAQP